MKNLLLSLTLITGLLVGCDSAGIDDSDDIFLRIKNASSTNFSSVQVAFREAKPIMNPSQRDKQAITIR